MFSNKVLKQDLVNDRKGLESLSEIICCVLWHGPVMEFILYLHCMYINSTKIYAVNLNLWKYCSIF